MSGGGDNPFAAHSAAKDGDKGKLIRWLAKPENDADLKDDHGFSCIHWAAYSGHMPIVELLLKHGVDANARNCGGDTALHNAVQQGHAPVIAALLAHKVEVGAVNAHGNTPLHYACFWRNAKVAAALVRSGALAMQENRSGQTPLDVTMSDAIRDGVKATAKAAGQDVDRRVPFNPSDVVVAGKGMTTSMVVGGSLEIELGSVTRGSAVAAAEALRDAVSEWWQGSWSGKEVTVRQFLLPAEREVGDVEARGFVVELELLRQIKHDSICPVLGACCGPADFAILAPTFPLGTLDQAVRSGVCFNERLVVRAATSLANGMLCIHGAGDAAAQLFALRAQTCVVAQDLSVKLALGNTDFKLAAMPLCNFHPAFTAPELLKNSSAGASAGGSAVGGNARAAHVFSFAMVVTLMLCNRLDIYPGLSPMAVGMKVAMENARPELPASVPAHLRSLLTLCWSTDPVKRPAFKQVLPILEKCL